MAIAVRCEQIQTAFTEYTHSVIQPSDRPHTHQLIFLELIEEIHFDEVPAATLICYLPCCSARTTGTLIL